MATEATCGTCPHWAQFGPSSECGECRVDSPMPGCSEPWPVVHNELWCGRHPARKAGFAVEKSDA